MAKKNNPSGGKKGRKKNNPPTIVGRPVVKMEINKNNPSGGKKGRKKNNPSGGKKGKNKNNPSGGKKGGLKIEKTNNPYAGKKGREKNNPYGGDKGSLKINPSDYQSKSDKQGYIAQVISDGKVSPSEAKNLAALGISDYRVQKAHDKSFRPGNVFSRPGTTPTPLTAREKAAGKKPSTLTYTPLIIGNKAKDILPTYGGTPASVESKQQQEEAVTEDQANPASLLTTVQDRPGPVQSPIDAYDNMLLEEADVKRKALEEQRLALRAARANAARSSVGRNLQIRFGGGVSPFSGGSMSRRSGTGQFKRRLNIGQSNMVNI